MTHELEQLRAKVKARIGEFEKKVKCPKCGIIGEPSDTGELICPKHSRQLIEGSDWDLVELKAWRKFLALIDSEKDVKRAPKVENELERHFSLEIELHETTDLKTKKNLHNAVYDAVREIYKFPRGFSITVKGIMEKRVDTTGSEPKQDELKGKGMSREGEGR